MENNIIKLTFTGDVMCKKKLLTDSCLNGKYDFSYIFAEIKSYFKNSYVIANLETPIASEDLGFTNESFIFNTPIEYIEALKSNEVNMVTTANNHCLDRGIDGLKNTIDALEKVNLEHTGTYKTKKDSEKIFIKKFGRLKVAFLSYTYGTNAMVNHNYLDKNSNYVNLFRKQEKAYSKYRIIRGLNRRIFSKIKKDKFSQKRDSFYLNKMLEQIKQAREESDIVIMCMHSGGQYNKVVEPYTKKLSEYLIDNGVDYVVGNHPHVVLDSKKYKNKFIAYSLGNFITVPYANPNQKDNYPDYSILLNFYLNTATKKMTKITFSVARTIYNKENKLQVIPVFKLVNSLDGKDKEKLIEETKHIVYKFSKIKTSEILEEYIIEGDNDEQ